MSSVDASLPTASAILSPEGSRERFRTLALASGVLLMGAFLSVFNYITDVAGGTIQLAVAVIASLLVATKVADRFDKRTATMAGLALFGAGLLVYLLAVPRVIGELVELDFFPALLSYTTGISVLQFLRVDVWAVALAPAPTFLTWYLLLRREYGASVVVGTLTLGFFAVTSDASEVIVLAGVVGAFGVLAFGTLERVDGSWDQVEQLGLVAVLVVLAARTLDLIPEGNGSPFGDGLAVPTLEASLLSADPQVEVLGSISLSPEVRFTIESSRPAYWRAGSYDRYTGGSWIRTGKSTEYDGPLDPPPGPSQRVRQRVTVETRVESLPTAWKPVAVEDAGEADVRVTALAGFLPGGPLLSGDGYTVVSEVPNRSIEALQAAGEDYPEEVAERYLEVPEDLPERVAEHAAEISSDASTPFEKAVRVEQWLTANKQYSLRVNRPDGDVVDGFVFGMAEGYCVYFASAMTVMLRTLDVPARFAVGYSTGQEIDENRWVVRGLDSHAWVEVYFPEIGWIPFDPTPSTPRTSRRQRRIQVARNRNETDVDTDETLPPIGTPTATPTPTPTETPWGGNVTVNGSNPGETSATPAAIPERFRDSESGPNSGGGPVTGFSPEATANSTATGTSGVDSVIQLISERDRISLLAGVAGVVLGVHHFGLVDRFRDELWLHHQPRTDSPAEDVERAYARLERVLARRHRGREEGETPRQYVRSLAEGGASLDDRVRRVAAVYEHTRYAGEASREEADQVIDIVDDVVSTGDAESAS